MSPSKVLHSEIQAPWPLDDIIKIARARLAMAPGTALGDRVDLVRVAEVDDDDPLTERIVFQMTRAEPG